MQANRLGRFGEPMFLRPEDAMKAIEQDGFSWRLVREYFRFTDDWLSEGQYERMLELAMASIKSDTGRIALLDMLDLEYMVFLEQVAIQEQMLGKAACDEYSVAFGERVMGYLQINYNHRPQANWSRKSARSVLFGIPPGTLLPRLIGESSSSASSKITVYQEDRE